MSMSSSSSTLTTAALLFYLFLLPFFSFSVSATITIPLSKSDSTIITPLSDEPSDPWRALNHLATSSLKRAHHLKFPNHKNTSVTTTPMYPRSYGGYSISLSYGTPPQQMKFVMDTGSSLVWFPCTHRYACSNCSFPDADPVKTGTFIPNMSNSSRILGCRNSKCGWLYKSNPKTRCRDCDPNSDFCNQACPAYLIQYGSGTTAGLLLLDSLDFPGKTVPNFVAGCSILSVRQPEGIAGFGRSPISLPAQMGLKKFSYCLVSHKFDDTPISSDLVLTGANSRNEKTDGVTYTPFRKNPEGANSAFLDYYYVTLRKVIVGNKVVKIPYKLLVPGAGGDGGTIVDSGSTFTFMDKRIFDNVATEFEKQMTEYKRATEIEIQSGLKPCFDVSGKKLIKFPELLFHLKGGAKMTLPLANYFSFIGGSGAVCMTMVTSDFDDGEVAGGPAIILGNYQQQNYYVEYDLEHEKFGFRKQVCNNK